MKKTQSSKLKTQNCEVCHKAGGTSNGASGFSLLEVLVTLFFVGLILVLYQSVLGKVRLIHYVQNEEVALQVANNKMGELRAGGYDALPESGSFSDSRLDDLPNSSASMTITDFNAGIKVVAATVEWRETAGAAPLNITLTTLVAKTGGL
ncbi:MAG TPA: hypothetical protein VK254_01015 [Candidatus Bathyarchaeia archaeon]|nr:hypothetical protein [Candidatus Bathyarchaeia archaeon]